LTDAPGWTDEAPVWSPDGRWLVFVRRRAAAGEPPEVQLWAVRPDGGDAQVLATGLDGPPGAEDGFGYYGTFRWWDMFAVAPAPAALPQAGAGLRADGPMTGAGALLLAGCVLCGLLGARHIRRRATEDRGQRE
jgi:hypothetical protein